MPNLPVCRGASVLLLLLTLPLSSALVRRSFAKELSSPNLETCSPLVNHESFSSVEVRIGTPAQTLNLVADTGSNNVIAMSCACLLTKSCPDSYGACFRGENTSSTFVVRNTTSVFHGRKEVAPESLLIEFGSGRIGAYVASDVVHVGSVRTFLEDSLLLMVKQKLSLPGPFEGILGLGQPPQGEAAAKTQLVPGFLEKAGIQRFSMCFNYEGDGVLGLHVSQSPSTWLRSLGQMHWGLELQGISVGQGDVSFCSSKQKQPGQQTACGMIPDSGTTLINGPREQVLQLYEAICRSWPRCMQAQAGLEKELNNLTAENQTLSGVALLQDGEEFPGLGAKGILKKVLRVIAGTFANKKRMNATPSATDNSTQLRSAEGLSALSLWRNETKAPGGKDAQGGKPLSVRPSDTFQLLLRHCAEWIEQFNVDDELPELSFHVAGAQAKGQVLTLRPASYVLQASMDVATPHIETVMGFLPMEVFQTRQKQVCMPAFAVEDYRTKANGDVWIIGTPLFYEYTVHYDRTAGAPSMAFSYAGDVACGTCKGERIVRDGPSLLSKGASKPDGMSSLRQLKHAPVSRPFGPLRESI